MPWTSSVIVIEDSLGLPLADLLYDLFEKPATLSCCRSASMTTLESRITSRMADSMAGYG
jgi:hypothetical protein